MRVIWVGVLFTGSAAMAACGNNSPNASAGTGGAVANSSGGATIGGAAAGNAGVGGNSATGGSGGSGGSNNFASGGAVVAGASASGGAATSGATSFGTGGSDTGGTYSNGNGGQSGGADTGGALGTGNGGQSGGAGVASGGNGSGGSSAGCNVATNDKRIFVSSALYTGDLGGLVGADSKCQALANAAGFCGIYRAWLTDGSADASTRLTHATGNYVLPDNQIVASGWSDLTSGTLQHAINLTEGSSAAPVGTVTCGGTQIAPVWTGAAANGIAVTNGNCSNWSSTSYSIGGIFGSALATSAAWSGMCQLTAVCQSTAALYCVQQ